MGNKKNKNSRKGKLGGASSIAASGHSRGELLRESSEVAGAISGSKRTIRVNGVGGKKKKAKSDVVDREEEEGISNDEADEVVGDDEADEVVGGDEADEVPDNEQVLDDDACGHGGIEEESTISCISITTNRETVPCIIIITTNPATVPCIIITTNPATSFNRATRVSEMGTSHA
ncbi:hypothetical protein Bca4012_100237 [Brassica carinata]